MEDAVAEILESVAQDLAGEFGNNPEVVFTSVPPEDIRPSFGLSVLVKDTWVEAERSTWRSWTGRRAIWGLEYHGDVYKFDSEDDSTPWTGRRSCGCATCQRHVVVESKTN